MPIVTWRDEYSVNVEEIDVQHRKILELVNNLHASVENCLDKQELAALMIELVEYTRMHFSTEEKLMNKHAYPERVKHHNEHKVLLQHMDNLVAAISNEKYPTFYSDYDVSSDWAIIHITESDKHFGAFLNSRNVF